VAGVIGHYGGLPAAKTVDEYIERQGRFGADVSRSRWILLQTGLNETVKPSRRRSR
jgi:hypothetical protein